MSPALLLLPRRSYDLLLWIYLQPARIRFRWRERRRLAASTRALASLQKLYTQAAELGLDNVKQVHNVGMYILLLDLDLTTLSWYMLHARYNWQRGFAARQIAVILHEASRRLPQLVGGNYRKGLQSLGVRAEVFNELNTISKQLNCFRAEHERALGIIRNFVGAHRDEDAAAQLKIIAGLQPLEIFGLVGDFYLPLRQLVDFQIRLTVFLANLRVLLKQYLHKAGSPASPDQQEGAQTP